MSKVSKVMIIGVVAVVVIGGFFLMRKKDLSATVSVSDVDIAASGLPACTEAQMTEGASDVVGVTCTPPRSPSNTTPGNVVGARIGTPSKTPAGTPTFTTPKSRNTGTTAAPPTPEEKSIPTRDQNATLYSRICMGHNLPGFMCSTPTSLYLTLGGGIVGIIILIMMLKRR